MQVRPTDGEDSQQPSAAFTVSVDSLSRLPHPRRSQTFGTIPPIGGKVCLSERLACHQDESGKRRVGAFSAHMGAQTPPSERTPLTDSHGVSQKPNESQSDPALPAVEPITWSKRYNVILQARHRVAVAWERVSMAVEIDANALRQVERP